MKVLLTGAEGFIVGRLRRALLDGGHDLLLGTRRRPQGLGPREDWLPLDFARPEPARWAAALRGVEAAVNGIGIRRERGAQTFAALHVEGPRALFDACVRAGVRRVVHLSALGADAAATSAYHRSKRAGDALLLGLAAEASLDAFVVQPSLVFGLDGVSARLFVALASAPVLVVPAGGHQRVQPVHVDDVVEALLRLVVAPPFDLARRRIALVGPEPLALRDYLKALRRSLGVDGALVLSVPAPLVELAAGLGSGLAALPLDRETWGMLQRGNVAPPDDTRLLLGRDPRAPERFVAPEQAAALRRDASLAWLLPVLRVSVAALWIWTGIVSLGLYPVEDSYALLERTGLLGAAATVALYGAALLDLALGIATLALRRRRALWLAQIVLVLTYTAIISARLPEFWLHPYGPVLKNLPVLALLVLLWTLDDGGRRERRRTPS